VLFWFRCTIFPRLLRVCDIYLFFEWIDFRMNAAFYLFFDSCRRKVVGYWIYSHEDKFIVFMFNLECKSRYGRDVSIVK
jgi:hypothetical protein